MSEPAGAKDRGPAAGDRVRYLASLAGAAVERFPAASLFVLLFAAAANRLVALSGDEPGSHWRLLFALLAAGALATAVQLAIEVRRTGPVLRYAMPTLAGFLAGSIVFRSGVPFVEVPLLLLVCGMAVPLAPFLMRERDGESYWTFMLWGLAGAALAFVAVMVSISGLTTALELFRLFFGIGPSFQAYAHVYVTAFGFVGPMFALASLPGTGAGAPVFSADDRLIRLVRPLVEWIAPALLLLQGAVLHLYAPLALFGRDGRMDAALLATSFLAGVVMLRVMLHPFLPDLAALARLYVRFWLWLVPVPLALILFALLVVARDGGIDAAGYGLGATAAAAVVVVLAQRVGRLRGDIVVMSAVPLVFLLVAAVGPLSVANVASRSQAALIETRFGEAVRGQGELGEDDRRAVRRSVRILAEFDQLDRLAPVIGEERLEVLAEARPRSSTAVADRLLVMLGLPDEPAGEVVEEETWRTLDGGGWSVFPVRGFDVVASSLPLVVGDAYRPEPTDPSLAVDGTVLVIRFGAEEDRVDLAGMIAVMPPALFDAGRVDIPLTELTTEEGRTVGVRVDYLSVDGQNRPQGGQLTLLMRSGEWASLGGDRPR